MRYETDIVSAYADASPKRRVEIILDNFRDIPMIIEGDENTLKILVTSEKRYNRSREKDGIGVRIQSGGCGDPTASEAIENLAILEAIRSCRDLDNVMAGTDYPEEYKRRAYILQDMREDYNLIASQLQTLPANERIFLSDYLQGLTDIPGIMDSENCAYSTAKNRVWRFRKHIKTKALVCLTHKYSSRGE